MLHTYKRLAVLASAFLLASGILSACGGGDSDSGASAGPLQIQTLSNRADMISDGDALVEIVPPTGVAVSTLKVTLNGSDVSAQFATRKSGKVLGVLTGLTVGTNTVTASLSGATSASLTITNAPRSGPVFSGAQIKPYYCATPTPQGATGTTPATNASGLSGAPDANCTSPTEYKFYYRTTAAGCSFAVPDPSPTVSPTDTAPPATVAPPANPCFKPYTVGAAAPADMATVTPPGGVAMPYIVRVERGVINRGLYDIAVLFNPAQSWTAVAPQAQWSGKVYYQFQGGSAQPRRQYRTASPWTVELALTKGYMVASNSLSDSGYNTNRTLSAETAMMMKEHIIDAYGPVNFVHGTGCSGGAVNSHIQMSVTPNLIDGFTPQCTFPDFESPILEIADCSLLVEGYQKAAWLQLMTTGNGGAAFSQAQINAMKTAINGHMDQSSCQAWFGAFGPLLKSGTFYPRVVSNPSTGEITQSAALTNACQLPNAVVYDPVTNPTGVRCAPWDWAASVWGTAADGRPMRPYDNTGVQYGLKALLSGAIDGEAFVTINEVIGGYDKDGRPSTTRSVGDSAAIATAYRAGLVTTGTTMARHAEINLRGWDDSSIVSPPGVPLSGGVHHAWRAFSQLDRRQRDAGNTDGYVMWRYSNSLIPSASIFADAFSVMDTWLDNIKADTSARTIEQKVIAAKPATAFTFCYLTSDAAQTTKVRDQSVCDADPYLVPHASPRQIAGGARTEDVLKCQLRPLSSVEYGGRLSAAQFTRLQAVFPDGVCDWTKPGVGQQAQLASPVSFQSGPSGTPLPPEPVSTPTP